MRRIKGTHSGKIRNREIPLKRLLRAFSPSPKSKYKPLDARTIAKRYGRGDVKLMLGKIMTIEEYEEQRRRVLAYEF